MEPPGIFECQNEEATNYEFQNCEPIVEIPASPDRNNTSEISELVLSDKNNSSGISELASPDKNNSLGISELALPDRNNSSRMSEPGSPDRNNSSGMSETIDIEDLCNDNLNLYFKQARESNIALNQLVLHDPEATSFRAPKLKDTRRLHTEHHV